MIKLLKYILFLCCLIGCFEIHKPFENEKVTMPVIKAINAGLYIDNIIGLSNKTEIKLKTKIYNKILNKNIITSYKYFNKNSYILKSTVVKYKAENKKKIILNISSSSSNETNKLELLISNKNLDNLETQEQISIEIAEFVEKIFLKKNKIRLIKIKEIIGLQEYKNLESIFLKKLAYLSSQQSIEIITNESINSRYYYMDVKFNIDKINDKKIKLRVTWLVFDQNKKLIGNIKQENIFLKSLLTTIWSEISNKIIEMSLIELNILMNVQK